MRSEHQLGRKLSVNITSGGNELGKFSREVGVMIEKPEYGSCLIVPFMRVDLSKL